MTEIDIGMACAEYAKYLSDTFWARQIMGFLQVFVVLIVIVGVWYYFRKKFHEDFGN